ncbi:MAG: hypothetical protein AAB581_03320 [Patescibacteria group bacterium]
MTTEKKNYNVLFVSEMAPVNAAMDRILNQLFSIGEVCGLEDAEDKIFAGNYTHIIVMGEFRSNTPSKGRDFYQLLKLRLPIWRKDAKVLKSGMDNIQDDPDYVCILNFLPGFIQWVESH